MRGTWTSCGRGAVYYLYKLCKVQLSNVVLPLYVLRCSVVECGMPCTCCMNANAGKCVGRVTWLADCRRTHQEAVSLGLGPNIPVF